MRSILITNTGYLRGVVAARLANKDNWLFIIAGSKRFVNFIANRSMSALKGAVMISPHTLVAGDIAANPELWVMIVAQLKATDPIEARDERRELGKVLKFLGDNVSLDGDQDIFIIMEPKSPKWAVRLATNYFHFLVTGEGEMEPRF